jgi:hypothetical protein
VDTSTGAALLFSIRLCTSPRSASTATGGSRRHRQPAPPAVLDAERFNIPKKAISAATWSLGGCDPSRIQSRSKPIKALVEFPAGPKKRVLIDRHTGAGAWIAAGEGPTVPR